MSPPDTEPALILNFLTSITVRSIYTVHKCPSPRYFCYSSRNALRQPHKNRRSEGASITWALRLDETDSKGPEKKMSLGSLQSHCGPSSGHKASSKPRPKEKRWEAPLPGNCRLCMSSRSPYSHLVIQAMGKQLEQAVPNVLLLVAHLSGHTLVPLWPWCCHSTPRPIIKQVKWPSYSAVLLTKPCHTGGCSREGLFLSVWPRHRVIKRSTRWTQHFHRYTHARDFFFKSKPASWRHRPLQVPMSPGFSKNSFPHLPASRSISKQWFFSHLPNCTFFPLLNAYVPLSLHPSFFSMHTLWVISSIQWLQLKLISGRVPKLYLWPCSFWVWCHLQLLKWAPLPGRPDRIMNQPV